MKRVIIASSRYYDYQIDDYEGMSDEEIMWTEMHDAWQEACRRVYNSIIDSDQIEDMDYGQLVDYVADHASVQTNIAGYFVDEFMRQDPEPVPLRASTSVKRFKVFASK